MKTTKTSDSGNSALTASGADILALKKVVNSLIDNLQAYGLVG